MFARILCRGLVWPKRPQTKQAVTITHGDCESDRPEGCGEIWEPRGLRRDLGVESLETETLWGIVRPLNTKMGGPISALLLES